MNNIEQLARNIRDHADPIWNDMQRARELGLVGAEKDLTDIVAKLHGLARDLEIFSEPLDELHSRTK